MRGIKFRSYVRGVMIDFTLEDLYSTEGHEIVIDYGANIYVSLDDALNNIMQYTGLKDKNGVRIYEGDILETDGFLTLISYGAGVYLSSNLLLKIPNKMFRQSELYNVEFFKTEVVGNMYENPELLENEK